MAPRMAPRQLLSLLLLLHRGCCAVSLQQRTLTPPRSIGVLQWNLHGECFVSCKSPKDKHCDKGYPGCRDNATGLLRELLGGSMGSLDFAGVEQLNDAVFLSSGLPEPWANVTHTCGGAAGFGVYPFDSASILYRRSAWRPLGGAQSTGPQGGCMEKVHDVEEPNYRAFVLQAFERVGEPSNRILVVAAHEPHTLAYPREINALADAVRAAQERTGVRRLILAADSNWEAPSLPVLGRSSQRVMEDIYQEAGPVASTKLHLTCCAWTYVHSYDRVIAAGFSDASGRLETRLPFDGDVPAWVALNMHSPILGWVPEVTGS